MSRLAVNHFDWRPSFPCNLYMISFYDKPMSRMFLISSCNTTTSRQVRICNPILSYPTTSFSRLFLTQKLGANGHYVDWRGPVTGRSAEQSG
eukprot:1149912-Pelagomonas_calceolata.AAC.1